MKITKVSGPVVFSDVEGSMNDIVRLGDKKLLGEIIEIRKDTKIIQVYEDTTGLKPGDKVINTNKPLSVELGPGLLGSVFDGTQRPLNKLLKNGPFIKSGEDIEALENKKWEFKPIVKEGDIVQEGQIIGEVKENSLITHKIMVPIGLSGKIENIKKGKYSKKEVIANIGPKKIYLANFWPVRIQRPVKNTIPSRKLLVSGTRIIDFLYPIPKGGIAAIPGPFGAGKTVTQQQFAKWCDADIIVYVGCGERGNEMTDILEEFPELEDPKTKEPLMNRTVLIANTSNMPVAAREASIYTGITIAEYFRDQGFDVALMADSTSRWAEAMREISGRLEEMPGEEGYPAYLSKKLAGFYERAGSSLTLSGKKASISVIGAVSPAGGDFSEPVTQNTLRITRAFWALDAKLADKRHYPAIDWLKSYSLYFESLKEDLLTKDENWMNLKIKTQQILSKEAKLQEIVQLVGLDSLPREDQILMLIAKIIKEDFLQQNAFHEEDTYSNTKKTIHMIKTIIKLYEATKGKQIDVEKLKNTKVIESIANMKYEKVTNLDSQIKKAIAESVIIQEV